MKYIISIYIILLIILLTGCKKTPKLQVRGVNEYPKAICLRELEKQNCKSFLKCISKKVNKSSNCLSDGKMPLACDLWDYSTEKFKSDCTKNNEGNTFTVSIIEFNDKGVVNEKQLEQTLNLLALTKIRYENKSSYMPKTEPPLVILFAHGWHHNSQVCDTNLSCFRSVLENIKKKTTRDVVGIYLGWRGESYSGLNPLTLFSRKSIAQRIGKNDGLQVLLKIDNVTKGKDIELISVGHSLGAALIFTAVKHKLVTSVGKQKYIRPIGNLFNEEHKKNPSKVKRVIQEAFGDLVVLVNPAIEAWEFEPFHEDYNPNNKYRPRERVNRPEMIVIASKSDLANRGAFPLSRIIQYSWRPKNIFKGMSNLKSMGQYKKHVTHVLSYVIKDEDKKSITISEFDKVIKQSEKDKEALTCTCNYNTQVDPIKIGEHDLRPYLRNKEAQAFNSEFLVIETDKSVIPAHSAIYTPRFIDFITKVVTEKIKFPIIEIDNTE